MNYPQKEITAAYITTKQKKENIHSYLLNNVDCSFISNILEVLLRQQRQFIVKLTDGKKLKT